MCKLWQILTYLLTVKGLSAQTKVLLYWLSDKSFIFFYWNVTAHLRVTQWWSKSSFLTFPELLICCSASWSFFLCRGCFTPSSCKRNTSLDIWWKYIEDLESLPVCTHLNLSKLSPSSCKDNQNIVLLTLIILLKLENSSKYMFGISI